MSKASQVHNEIMNIQVNGHERLYYKIGHRDARHAAAEIAMQTVAKLEVANRRLVADRQAMADTLSIVIDRAGELRTENQRLRVNEELGEKELQELRLVLLTAIGQTTDMEAENKHLKTELAEAIQRVDKAEAENQRLLKLFDFILNECDWEENRGNKGDDRIGKACRKARQEDGE